DERGVDVGVFVPGGAHAAEVVEHEVVDLHGRRVGLRAGLEVRDDVDVHQLVPRQVGDREIEVVLGDGDQPGAGFGRQAADRVPGVLEEGLPGLLEHGVVDGLLGGEVRVQRG